MKRKALTALIMAVICLTQISCSAEQGREDSEVSSAKSEGKMSSASEKQQDETSDETVPQKEVETISFSGVSLGLWHTTVIKNDGNLYLWGSSDDHGLRHGYSDNHIDGFTSAVVDVSLGGLHCAAITEDGSLYMWGDNEYGQLGNGEHSRKENSRIPQKIMDNVASVSLGMYHSAAITTDGSLYVWGFNHNGELGNGQSSPQSYNYEDGIDSTVPIKIMDNVAKVYLGEHNSAAITEDGTLYMWGLLTKDKIELTPIEIMDNVAEVSLGQWHNAAILKNGELYMWGNDAYEGRLGLGTCSDISNPTLVMDDVIAVDLGDKHSAAITSDHSLYVWGSNNVGQLGFYDNNDCKSKPYKLMDNVVAVELGYECSAAVTENGELYMWGNNFYNNIVEDSSIDNVSTPILITDNVVTNK